MSHTACGQQSWANWSRSCLPGFLAGAALKSEVWQAVNFGARGRGYIRKGKDWSGHFGRTEDVPSGAVCPCHLLSPPVAHHL